MAIQDDSPANIAPANDGNKTSDVPLKGVFRPWMIIIALIIIAAYQYHFINFTWDDPFITWRYAENFANGKGLVFNDGQRVEGYSNLLYVLIFALLYKVHIYWGELRLLYPAKIIGSITSLALILLTVRYATKLDSFRRLDYPKAAIIIGFLAASNIFLHIWAMCGMETLLFPTLILWGNLVLIKGLESEMGSRIRSFVVSGFIFFLVSITRADGFLMVLVTLMFILVTIYQKKVSFKEGLSFLLTWLVPSLAVLGWRYSYYGEIFPMSYYSKATGGWEQVLSGFSQWWLGANHIFGNLAVYLVMYLPLITRKGRVGQGYYLIFMQALFYQLYIIWSGYDWLLGNRFFVHILPQLELMLFAGICEAFKLDKDFKPSIINDPTLEKKRTRLIFLIVILAGMAGFYGNRGFYAYQLASVQSGYKNLVDYAAGKSDNPSPSWMPIEDYEAGIWMKENAQPTDLLAICDIGAIPYISEVQVLDCFGLADKYVAKLPGDFFFEKYDIDYILGDKPGYNERPPDFILLQGYTWAESNGELRYKPRRKITDEYMVVLWDDDRFHQRYELIYSKYFFLIYKLKNTNT